MSFTGGAAVALVADQLNATTRDGAAKLTRGETARYAAVDGLRFALAAIVMIYHYAYAGPLSDYTPGDPMLSNWAVAGRYAVHAFFMISGFVIAFTAEGRAPAAFLKARVVRLWPAVALCATITFLLSLAAGPAFAQPLSEWLGAVSFVNIMRWGPYIDPAYWSLTVEVRFYALIFLLMLVIDIQARMLTIVAVWLGVSWMGLGRDDMPVVEQISLGQHSAFFAIGMLIYVLTLQKNKRLWALALLIPTVWLAGRQIIVSDATQPAAFQLEQPEFMAYLLVLAGAGLLGWAILLSASLQRAGDGVKSWLSALGAISYPLYLIHSWVGYIIIVWAMQALGPSTPNWVCALIGAACALAIATFTALWWEKRIKRTVAKAIDLSFAWAARVLAAPLGRALFEARAQREPREARAE